MRNRTYIMTSPSCCFADSQLPVKKIAGNTEILMLAK